MSPIAIRFSYNDMLLFKRIIKSIPEQINAMMTKRQQEEETPKSSTQSSG